MLCPLIFSALDPPSQPCSRLPRPHARPGAPARSARRVGAAAKKELIISPINSLESRLAPSNFLRREFRERRWFQCALQFLTYNLPNLRQQVLMLCWRRGEMVFAARAVQVGVE